MIANPSLNVFSLDAGAGATGWRFIACLYRDELGDKSSRSDFAFHVEL